MYNFRKRKESNTKMLLIYKIKTNCNLESSNMDVSFFENEIYFFQPKDTEHLSPFHVLTIYELNQTKISAHPSVL